MPLPKGGRKFYHLLNCRTPHLYETSGGLFNLDEVRCKKHGYYVALIKTNMNKYTAELLIKQLEHTK